jgi:hypothetical protein
MSTTGCELQPNSPQGELSPADVFTENIRKAGVERAQHLSKGSLRGYPLGNLLEKGAEQTRPAGRRMRSPERDVSK